MLKKILAVSLVMVLSALVSGCVVVAAGIGAVISEGEAGKLSGIVEVGEVKMKPGVDVALLKMARLSSVVFEKDMTTLNTSPGPTDAKVNAAATDEVKRSLGIPENAISPVTVRLKTLYIDSYPSGNWYYLSVTERNTIGYFQSEGIRKLVNAHFLLEQGGGTLLEVHGLWVSGNQGDEIAGATKLAKEIVSEVMKNLSVTSAPSRESVAEAEAKKE